MIHYQDEAVTLHAGDCLDILREIPDNSVDAVVTDPPAGDELPNCDRVGNHLCRLYDPPEHRNHDHSDDRVGGPTIQESP